MRYRNTPFCNSVIQRNTVLPFLYIVCIGQGFFTEFCKANIYFLFFAVSGNPDAPHITAIAGQKITLNCDVNFPNGVASPYVVQWWRKVVYNHRTSTAIHYYIHFLLLCRVPKFRFSFGTTTILSTPRPTSKAACPRCKWAANMAWPV